MPFGRAREACRDEPCSPLFFLHIPKTGGQSLRNAFLQKCGETYTTKIALVYPRKIHYLGRDMPCDEKNVEAIRDAVSSPGKVLDCLSAAVERTQPGLARSKPCPI